MNQMRELKLMFEQKILTLLGMQETKGEVPEGNDVNKKIDRLFYHQKYFLQKLSAFERKFRNVKEKVSEIEEYLMSESEDEELSDEDQDCQELNFEWEREEQEDPDYNKYLKKLAEDELDD